MNSNVAIYLSTRNRSDFVIRQLQYYASVNCPHPIYIGDASNEEHSNKIKDAIKSLENKITVIYKLYQESEIFTLQDSHDDLLSTIKEKYGASIGDDDYFIPDSLTKCAEFLEEHPDYATASGYAISFRLKNNGVYGELNYIADYPRKQIELETASERIINFFQEYYTSMFYVHRIDSMRKFWHASKAIPDLPFSTEMIPSALLLAEGKSKIIDCLILVRQIHDGRVIVNNTYDRIMNRNWYESHVLAENILVKEVAIIDKINSEDGKKVFRKALWSYLNKWLIKFFDAEFPSAPKEKSFLYNRYRALRSSIGKAFPIVKKIYRIKFKPLKTGIKYVHYEVLERTSKYYKDFKPVMDSFSNKHS